jgi:ABC-2 type transport system ATP-binding protein
MSIQVEGISKRYGEQWAVKDVSFSVSAGEIVGFIGPNGAGKTTTMKMITGTLRPDAGKVLIRGSLVSENSTREIRMIIGYLPEQNPLYPEMYIREYLEYVAGLYKLSGKEKRERIEEVIMETGLTKESHKRIGNLSKGYRQRVGLSQALIHNPEILILDEPTTGLDPNQIVEIRNLISEIGKEKTVLLSTHNLHEVETICDRVVIINQGMIVADGLSSDLGGAASGTGRTILVELDRPVSPDIWKQLNGILHVRALEGNQFLLETREESDLRSEIFNLAVSQGLTILSLSLKKKSLEEVFREITGA